MDIDATQALDFTYDDDETDDELTTEPSRQPVTANTYLCCTLISCVN